MTPKISVIGLGYVGLPLAIAFAKHYPVIGYDISTKRISGLLDNQDITNEVSPSMLKNSKALFTNNEILLKESDIFIVTVPTPVFSNNKPNLSMLKNACTLIGRFLKRGSIIIFESTVYPGCTEDYCIPILEKSSKLKLNNEFFVGYSPERINPGDKQHTFTKINKVVSASTPLAAKKIAKIYGKVIDAKIFIASSIKVAEAAKIIENTQRDINIALMNEFSLILQKMDIRTKDVLDAAKTKWNFLDFKPGLVGGHCIGVDPYYLAFKAQDLGINPRVILSGRDVNNSIPKHIVKKIILETGVKKPKILILGFTFEPDCPDIRNSKVLDVIKHFNKRNITPYLYDPLYESDPELNLKYIFKNSLDKFPSMHSILLLVPHKKLVQYGPSNLKKLLIKDGYFFDMSSSFANHESDGSL